ncbi:MAG: FliH/SctL family protein [Planctomycetota bacterium]|nr:FliH/SctL family protein [Planctomycetota bacterium]
MDLGVTPAEPQGVRIVEGYGARAFDRAIARVHDDGIARGRDLAAREAARALEAAVERLDAFREEAAEALSRTAVELTLAIAKHLLRAEVEAGRYDLERVVREMLQESGVGRASCTVHLHPADAAALEGVPFRAGTKVEADIGVPRGDVHVETPQGLFVRDLEDALESIGERLFEDLRG